MMCKVRHKEPRQTNRRCIKPHSQLQRGNAMLCYLVLVASVFVLSIPAFQYLKKVAAERLTYELAQPSFTDVKLTSK